MVLKMADFRVEDKVKIISGIIKQFRGHQKSILAIITLTLN